MLCKSDFYVSLYAAILEVLDFPVILYEFTLCTKTAQQSEAHMGMLELLKSRALLMPLGIGIVMQLSQQLSGKWRYLCWPS